MVFLRQDEEDKHIIWEFKKIKETFPKRFRLSNVTRVDFDATKLLFGFFLQKYKKGTQGFIHDIESNPIGFVMFNEIKVKI